MGTAMNLVRLFLFDTAEGASSANVAETGLRRLWKIWAGCGERQLARILTSLLAMPEVSSHMPSSTRWAAHASSSGGATSAVSPHL